MTMGATMTMPTCASSPNSLHHTSVPSVRQWSQAITQPSECGEYNKGCHIMSGLRTRTPPDHNPFQPGGSHSQPAQDDPPACLRLHAIVQHMQLWPRSEVTTNLAEAATQ